MRGAGTQELSVLATHLQEGCAAEAILDNLSLTNSPGSLRLVYEALVNFSEYARAKGWMTGALALQPPAKNPQPPIVVYRADEVEALVNSARGKSLRWWVFIATMAHTGRRVGEVLSLRWEWLHLDSEVPHFNLPYTKNKRQAYVPLDSMLVSQVFTPENVEVLKAQTEPPRVSWRLCVTAPSMRLRERRGSRMTPNSWRTLANSSSGGTRTSESECFAAFS